ncbi:MAG: dephospho-CoA kinase [Gammaproteobacteria bacterium]|nr:dephospho-CoA kinase [Gammaproteobacteria bacterium]
MLRIGLTGGIGSGKSTVAKIFSNLGITIIDADIIAHQLTQSGSDSFKEIKKLFGEKFINDNGELDRKKIAQTVFSNPSAKIALEEILHPKIKQRILQEIEKAHSSQYIILAIPLLLESDFTDLVDRTLVIDTNDDIRIKRIQQRDTRTEKQIREIMANQIDREHRLQRADDILNNNGNLEDLNSAVTRLHRQYMIMAS